MRKELYLKLRTWAFLPIFIFLIIYLGSGAYLGNFYKVSPIIVFLIGSAVALFQLNGMPLTKRFDFFAKGAGKTNIILVCFIYILAGAFGSIGKAIGSTEVAVQLGLDLLPPKFWLVSVFFLCCTISMALGTSVGTIAAVVPIAMPFSSSTGIPPEWLLGAIGGGAMFGDNMSFISDTTIIATRSQGAQMKDKFLANLKIALPAALVCALVYFFLQPDINQPALARKEGIPLIVLIPYVWVIAISLLGANVFIVLSSGLLLMMLVGLTNAEVNLINLLDAMNYGFYTMSDLIIISLLIGGIMQVVEYNGGINALLHFIEKNIRGVKGAQFGIAGLTLGINACIANNTITLIIVGPLVKKIASKFDISPKRAASLMDTASCWAQGILPYGAQVLVLSKLSGLSIDPVKIVLYLFYPFLSGIFMLLSIVFTRQVIHRPFA